METLKILMTNNTYPPFSIGGDANHVFLLSNELMKKGHEVHVICSRDSYELLSNRYNLSINKSEIKQDNGNIPVYSLESPLGTIDSFMTYSIGKSKFYYSRYLDIIKNINPDVVHHHDITFLGYNFFKKQGNYTSLYTAHNYWLTCPNRELFKFNKVCNHPYLCTLCLLFSKRPPQIWRWKLDVRKIVEDLDIIIAPSEFVKQNISERLDKNIVYIPNFINHPPENIEPSGYSNYFLYVGQLESRKGVTNLLEFFKKHNSDIDTNLIIVGAGSLEDKIRQFIDKYKLQNKILILGRVDKKILWSLYNDAHALLVPSIWPENNPLVALEALSVGTPVIGTNVGGLGEIVRKIDKNMIFDGDKLLDNIRLILDNKNRYSKEKIKKIYDRWYSPEVYLREYERILGTNNG